MAGFATDRVTSLVTSKAVPVAAVVAGHIGARAIDAAFALNRPWYRFSDYAHLAILGVSGYYIGTGKNVATMETVFIADATLIASSFGDWLYAKARGTSGRNPGSRAIREAEEAARLAAGKGNAVLDLSGVKSRSGSYIEF